MSDTLILGIGTIVANIIVALVAIIPSIISNRRKTEESIKTFKDEIKDNVDTVQKEVKEVKNALDAHIEEDKANDNDRRKKDMVQVRARILHFESECNNKYIPWPSEGMYMQNADDEATYRAFLNSDLAKDFNNGMCEDAMAFIDSTFRYCKENNMFGKPKGAKNAYKEKAAS